MELSSAINYYLIRKDAEGLSEKTVIGYRESLAKFSGWFAESRNPGDASDTRAVSDKTIFEYISWLKKRVGPVSVVHYLRALKTFVRWMHDNEITDMPVDPFAKVKMPRVPRRLPPVIPDEDFEKMLAACDRRGHMGKRDYAILCFLWDTGVRDGELRNLQARDVRIKQREADIIGKGNKERTVFFSPPTAGAMVAYRTMEEESWKARNRIPPTEFFVNDEDQPLGPRSVRSMLLRVAARAGVTSRMNPHSFRHTFATNFLRAGGDLESLRRILGHQSLEIVTVYTNLVTADLSAKHDQFSPMNRIGTGRNRNRRLGA